VDIDRAEAAWPPARTSPHELELTALRLFTQRGYDETAVDQSAAEAGVSSRTFFRYFDTKVDVLWYAFDNEVLQLRKALAEIPNSVPPARPP
jgi:AcrR family transcriptional regulator